MSLTSAKIKGKFVPLHAMKAREEVEVPLHLLPTSTLDRKSCQIQVQATVPPKT